MKTYFLEEAGSFKFLLPEEIKILLLRSTSFLHYLISKTTLKLVNIKQNPETLHIDLHYFAKQ